MLASKTDRVPSGAQWMHEVKWDGVRVLVDVREPNEYEINRIPGSVLIPKGDFLNGSALEQLPSVDSGTQVVLHCKSGVRSAEALSALHGAGFSNAVHVGGGVTGWAQQVDTSLPTY